MLKKVLKYDLKSIFKFLILFYTLSLFFGLMTRLFLSIENSVVMNVIGQICSGVTISMIFNILINNLMRLWVRFKQNLYGDESYLTHTLPLKKNTLYLSKVISAIITLFTSTVVIGSSLFIAYYSEYNLEMVKDMLLPIANSYGSTIITVLIACLFILFLEFVNVLQCGFTGIILGHKMNNAKIGFSVLYGFVTFIVSQIFVLLMIFLVALLNKDVMNLFITTKAISVDIAKAIIIMAIMTYIITLVINYYINITLFKKGVNVD